MLIPDVNVLVNAYRTDAENHRGYRHWVDELVNGDAAFGLSDVVLSGFVRIVTHPRVFAVPTRIGDALAFTFALKESPVSIPILPGPRHWRIFASLCTRVGARGNAVPDAFLAALAIESGGTFVTSDRGFARFPGLRWQHPLEVSES